MTIMKRKLIKRNLIYPITCLSRHIQSNKESTYLIRIVDSLDNGIELLESIYKDAESKRTTKYGGNYSNPKWLDDNHLKVQVTCDMVCGYIHSTTIETYELHDEWNFNVFSKDKWILN